MKRTAACSITVLAASLLSVRAQTQPPVDPKIARTVLRPLSAAKVEVRTVKYRAADDVELPADIYFNPDTKGPRPTLLFISGTEDARDWSGYRDFGRLAAERGFVGIVPAKRFPRGGAGIAQGRSDTLALLERLDQLAPDLIDRARVCLWAFSGGGTTLSLAYGKDRPQLNCVVGFYPAVSSAASAPEEWLNTYSPAHVVALHGSAEGPRTLIVQAGKDSEALNKGIAEFTAKALGRNVPLTVINLPHAQHGFDLFDDNDWSREAIEQAFDFAKRTTSPQPAR